MNKLLIFMILLTTIFINASEDGLSENNRLKDIEVRINDLRNQINRWQASLVSLESKNKKSDSDIMKPHLRLIVEEEARQFGEWRASPIKYSGHWAQAFIAYTVNELKLGKSYDEIKTNIRKVDESTVNIFKASFYNDEAIRPYFNAQTIENGFELQEEFIEMSWAEIFKIDDKVLKS